MIEGGGGPLVACARRVAAFLLLYRDDPLSMRKVCQDGPSDESPISVLYHGNPQ